MSDRPLTDAQERTLIAVQDVVVENGYADEDSVIARSGLTERQVAKALVDILQKDLITVDMQPTFQMTDEGKKLLASMGD